MTGMNVDVFNQDRGAATAPDGGLEKKAEMQRNGMIALIVIMSCILVVVLAIGLMHIDPNMASKIASGLRKSRDTISNMYESPMRMPNYDAPSPPSFEEPIYETIEDPLYENIQPAAPQLGPIIAETVA